MTDKQNEILAAVLANIVTKHSGAKDIFEAHLETLSIAERGWVYENVMRYPAGIDLAEVVSGNGYESQERPRYIVRTAADALKPQEPIDWVINPLFSTGSVSVIVGHPGSKKTYSMLSAAVCVALGKPWLGFSTRPAKVLIVDEESGERRLSRRLGDAIRGELGNDTTQINYVSLAQFNLREPDDVVLLQALIENTGAELVIIDALADIMPGGDENAVKDIQPVFIGLRKIAEVCKCAIVIIHHANKAGGYRGSTAINGAADLLLMVDSKSESPNIDFKTEKVRDTEPFSFAAVAHWEDGQFWLTEAKSTKGEPKYSKAQDYVLRYLKEYGASTISNLMDHADVCSKNAARQAIYSLASRKVIQRVDSGNQGAKAKYDFTMPQT